MPKEDEDTKQATNRNEEKDMSDDEYENEESERTPTDWKKTLSPSRKKHAQKHTYNLYGCVTWSPQ